MSILSVILGRKLATKEQNAQKIGVLTGISALGMDGLSSSAYGPEAALTILLPLGALGLNYIGPITLAILSLLTMVYFSYRQTIAAYPVNGGSYTVAKENLGVLPSLLAAAALMIDYVLNVAVGISAGVGALVSAAPHLHKFTLPLCLIFLIIITLANLRGTGEAGLAFAAPTYLFIASLGLALLIGLAKTLAAGGHPQPITNPPPLPAATEVFSLWLILRSFASGCTAMTGVEAVSNGVSAFKEPTIKNAHRTLTSIIVILAFFLGAIAYLCHAYQIGAMDQTRHGYQSVLSQLLAAIVGRGWFYYIAIGSVLAVLCLSANTSFVDFPRLCRLIAKDGFLPQAFATVGRRLVYSVGILSLASCAAALLIVFRGVTDRLIPLFAVGAFLAFTLSQAGMVMHWRKQLKTPEKSSATGDHAKQPGNHSVRVRQAVNAVGAICTAGALVIILAAKFIEGAWITVLAIPTIIFFFRAVRRHYNYVERLLGDCGPLDLSHNEPPVVLVPMRRLDRLTIKSLRFAMHMSSDVNVLHLSNLAGDAADNEESQLRQQWARDVEQPARAANIAVPQLRFVQSPYREFTEPLMQEIEKIKNDCPHRLVAVIIGEVVERHWWQVLLHSRRSMRLRSALRNLEDSRVVVTDLPWFVKK